MTRPKRYPAENAIINIFGSISYLRLDSARAERRIPYYRDPTHCESNRLDHKNRPYRLPGLLGDRRTLRCLFLDDLLGQLLSIGHDLLNQVERSFNRRKVARRDLIERFNLGEDELS